MNNQKKQSIITSWLSRAPSWQFSLYAMGFAFLTYFCMYAFRKPFGAATFAGLEFMGTGIKLKTAFVIGQIIGYTISKYYGCKFCSEIGRSQQAKALVLMIIIAESALLGFAILPENLKVLAIFINGLPLGMVWGLVSRYLEGRKTANKKTPVLKKLVGQFENSDFITEKILNQIKFDPPVSTKKGGYIQSGISPELDELRHLSANASQWMADMQREEQKSHNIPSLKVGYNRVFGYYIEVTKTHAEKVPEHYIRKQTLTNSERYFTEELKEYEVKILSAEEKIVSLESGIFESLQNEMLNCASIIQKNAKVLARLDVAAGLSKLAINRKYCRPEMDESSLLIIKDGKHPVVEDLLPMGEDFIPNDLDLDNDETQIAIITGPNMAGKSTYLRQVGLIVVMAQMGSYIPANSARIGVIDKLFTRVGASDNLAGGESTFLVEMNETANILNNATEKSLILLDEIGRGTSTYDGLSLAWAVTEYLHGHKDVQAKTLFATHYHELVALADQLPRAINLNVAVKEFGDKIVFLKKIISGGADKSYGVHVAEMAGLPRVVIQRAKELLQQHSNNESGYAPEVSLEMKPQMDLFSEKEQALKKELGELNVNEMTPLDALAKLDELKKKHGL